MKRRPLWPWERNAKARRPQVVLAVDNPSSSTFTTAWVRWVGYMTTNGGIG